MRKKLLLTAALLALLGGGIYAGSGVAVKPLATQFIRQNGFPTASIGQISLTPTGAMVDEIALDGNEFSTVENITIGFNWLDFLKTRSIHSLSIKDISLTCEIDDAGNFKIAGWNATIPQSSSSSGLLPIQSLLLQGITLDCETPYGNIRAEGKLSVETTNANEQILNYALWGQQHQLSFDAKGSGKLSADGNITLSTTLNDGSINLPHVNMSRASGLINFTKKNNSPTPVYDGKFAVGKINLGENILLQNVTAFLDTSKPEILSFQTSPAGHPNIIANGRWVTSPNNQLEMTIKSKSSLELVELLAPEKVKDASPWLKNNNPLTLSFVSPVTVLNTPQKPADFKLSLGNALTTSGKAVYDATSGGTQISFAQTNIAIAKGNVSVSPFQMNTTTIGKNPLPLILKIKSLDMNELAKIADIDGLKAEGSFSGTVPLTYSTKGIVFGQGKLKSDNSGTFAYAPPTPPPSLQGDDERMQTVRDALKDFQFSLLNIEMSGAVDGKMKTTLRAEGKSPAFPDRPINLNINLDGDLGKVMKQALQAGDIGDTIRSELEGRKK